MGNHLNCALKTNSSKNSTKIVLPTNEIRQLRTPTNAAELMFEWPKFFIVNSLSLKLGFRFSPLKADQDLEHANVYVMFSMKRLNSIVNTTDMARLFLVANSTVKRAGGKVRDLPQEDHQLEDCEEKKVLKLNLDDIEEYSTPEFQHRLSMSRSKKPLLETIEELEDC
ncbi:hypothetical protein ACFE04_009815 [Oxalis oulophora]